MLYIQNNRKRSKNGAVHLQFSTTAGLYIQKRLLQNCHFAQPLILRAAVRFPD